MNPLSIPFDTYEIDIHTTLKGSDIDDIKSISNYKERVRCILDEANSSASEIISAAKLEADKIINNSLTKSDDIVNERMRAFYAEKFQLVAEENELQQVAVSHMNAMFRTKLKEVLSQFIGDYQKIDALLIQIETSVARNYSHECFKLFVSFADFESTKEYFCQCDNISIICDESLEEGVACLTSSAFRLSFNITEYFESLISSLS